MYNEKEIVNRVREADLKNLDINLQEDITDVMEIAERGLNLNVAIELFYRTLLRIDTEKRVREELKKYLAEAGGQTELLETLEQAEKEKLIL